MADLGAYIIWCLVLIIVSILTVYVSWKASPNVIKFRVRIVQVVWLLIWVIICYKTFRVI
jgi:hypothetical protein